jgi:2-oxoglutarate dehydrogenase complex dehydrogenase (E1) component-like enzyme
MDSSPSALDALIADFGNNYGFALELLEQYRRDPGALDPSWRDYFARLPG